DRRDRRRRTRSRGADVPRDDGVLYRQGCGAWMSDRSPDHRIVAGHGHPAECGGAACVAAAYGPPAPGGRLTPRLASAIHLPYTEHALGERSRASIGPAWTQG